MLTLLFWLRDCFRSRFVLQAEILALRHQLLVLQRSRRGHKLQLRWADRVLWVWLSRLWKNWRSALLIVTPATVITWHRQGFRLYGKWKSRHAAGRPSVSHEIIALIRKMSSANPLWGAPRLHGELLKIGIEVSQATVAKYMVRQRRPPSQTWRTFLKNHARNLVSVDFFVVPTIAFQLLFVFVILDQERRRPLHFAVTSHPTAEWTARQLVQAFPWDNAPPLFGARPRRMLWRKVPRHSQSDGHSRGSHSTAITLAECLCRVTDGLNSSGMPRPRHRIQRVRTAPYPERVLQILRTLPNAFVSRERCSCWPPDRTSRTWPCDRDSPSRWPASSVYAQSRLIRRLYRSSLGKC